MVLLIYLDTWLHTPMYFLLSQLSLMDLMLICTTVPKMACNYLSGRKSISVAGCEAQIFVYVSLFGAEGFLFAVMAYDHYVAICYPLQYPNLVKWKVCGLMAASSWILGVFDGIVDVAATLSFLHCCQEISQFFCEVPAPYVSHTQMLPHLKHIYLLCINARLPFVTHHHLLHTCNYNCCLHEFWGGSAQGFHHLYFTPYCCSDVLWSSYIHIYEAHF